jgi:hypothetical protein
LNLKDNFAEKRSQNISQIHPDSMNHKASSTALSANPKRSISFRIAQLMEEEGIPAGMIIS